MNCFPCFSSKKSASKRIHDSPTNEFNEPAIPADNKNVGGGASQAENANGAQTFTFRELATATKNFRQECLLGEGGFGRVYKGTLQASGQVVAVKQLDRNGLQGSTNFVEEISGLGLLQHPNLVTFIGYCADGDQRLLVYEFIPGGSVEDHLFDITPEKRPFDWLTRMKIAYGAAQALEYLHDKNNPPVIYRDLKSSNILLDNDMNPKLSHYGLCKLAGPAGDSKLPMQSRAMGTYGYSAPEYARSGQVTTKSDVYSFGVVLLELITGRKAVDTTKPVDEQNLVTWAQPLFRDPKMYPNMADPLLKKRFPERGLNQAVAIAAMCLQEESAARPLMSDAVTALSFLSMATEENKIPATLPPSISSRLSIIIGDRVGSSFRDVNGITDKDNGTSDDSSSSDSGSPKHKGRASGHHKAVKKKASVASSQSSNSSASSQARSNSMRKDSRRSDDGSVSSSEGSTRGSRVGGGKSSRKLKLSLSRKSSKVSEYGSVSSGHKGSRKSLRFMPSGKSSRKSQGDEISLSSSSSSSSSDESVSSSRKIGKKSTDRGSGSASLRRKSTRKSSSSKGDDESYSSGSSRRSRGRSSRKDSDSESESGSFCSDDQEKQKASEDGRVRSS